MKTISILVYEDAVLSAISGALEILVGTNRFLKDAGKPAAFQIELVSEKLKNIRLQLPAQFICQKTLSEATQTDLVIAPAFNGDAEAILEKNFALVDWIKDLRQTGAEIASLCFGSYFLAEAGLLAGKPCTSHWLAVEDMKQRYPKAKVLSDKIITDEDGIYTSGGAFSSLNLILYLVEKFCGRQVAVQISKIFAIDMGRVSQAHFTIFQGQRDHDDKQILNAQTFMEQNYHREISIEDVAEQTHMSRRNFIRRFKKATNNTPLQYLQRVKVEAAKRNLEIGRKNVGEVMYDVGYSDTKSFRNLFRRITDLTPIDYRNKYNNEAAVQ